MPRSGAVDAPRLPSPEPLNADYSDRVRLTDFWARMRSHFGESYADSLARDHVMARLGGRTATEALEAGVDTKAVWRAVCDEFGLPARER